MSSTLTPPPILPERAAPLSPEEPRLGVLSGDRLCARCAFNLAGQTIVRERHYGLLMVRCPECGTPAALQEYPLLARSATRLGHLASAVYFLGMLAIALSASLVVWGTASALSEELGAPYQNYVNGVWAKHQQEEQQKNGVNATNWATDMQWWNVLDKNQLFVDAGGWKDGIAWRSLWMGVFVGLALVPFGVVLAVAAPHVKWKGRVGLALIVAVLGAAFWVLDRASVGAFGVPYMYAYGGYGSWRQLDYVLMPISLTVAAGWIVIGLAAGRPLARVAARLLLPPRLRGPLAFLWFVDGKPYPAR